MTIQLKWMLNTRDQLEMAYATILESLTNNEISYGSIGLYEETSEVIIDFEHILKLVFESNNKDELIQYQQYLLNFLIYEETDYGEKEIILLKIKSHICENCRVKIKKQNQDIKNN